MDKTQDTFDGLLAEFREHAAGVRTSGYVTMSGRDFHKMLDCLDAAHKRERGDCAKLREALCEILSYIESFHKYITPRKGKKLTALFAVADTILSKARAALAAPPRNCDRFASAEAAWDAYDAWVESYRAQGKTEPFNEFGWLFAPATKKEGGNDEQK